MIEVKNLEKILRKKTTCCEGLTKTINEGEVVCIIGPSGSGKSTFLRCLNLLEQPTSGEVILDGEKINAPDRDIDKIREKLGMVFQNFNLFPHMSVLDNITMAPIKVKRTSARRSGSGSPAPAGCGGSAGQSGSLSVFSFRGSEAACGHCPGAGDEAGNHAVR